MPILSIVGGITPGFGKPARHRFYTVTMQGAPSQNQPCPCGSGKKYKRCCGMAGARVSHGQELNLDQLIKLYQKGNLQAANHLARRLLKKQPDNPALVEITAVIAMQLGNADEAATWFSRQLALQPTNALAHSNLCMVLHSLGRDEDAYMHCQQAINLDPALPDAWNNLGNIYKKGNRLDKALEHYQQAIALGDNDPRTRVNAGSVSQLLGDLDAAETQYRAAIAIYPEFASAYNNLATILQKLERHEEAEEAFRQALGMEPGNPEFLCNYGSFLLERRQPGQAREYYEKALQADADFIGALINLGSLSEQQHDREAAARYYDKVLMLDPGNPTVHCNRGYRLLELGEQQAAIKHLESALKGNPHSAKALAGLGNALLTRNDIASARKHIEKAIQLAPWDIHAHIARARLHDKCKEYDEAEQEWNYVIEHKPGMSEGYIGLAQHYDDLGKDDLALAQFRRAEENNAAGLALYNAWSQMEEHLNHLDSAEQLAQKATEISPDYPGLKMLKAKLARRRNDYPGALALLQKIDPDNIEQRQAQARYLFELGDVQDKLGNYSAAFAAYDAANQAKNIVIGESYDEQDDLDKFSRWKQFFSRETWQALAQQQTPADDKSPTPVFIVGFPRSGTSLLEQILGSHPEIAPAGELGMIGELAEGKAARIADRSLAYPELLYHNGEPLPVEKLCAMRDFYLAGTRELGVADASTRWITDKMPHNAIHVGLIALLFPQSPIIHISRHPLNSCLSAYFANFQSSHRYTSSFASTAKHYKYFMEVLDHYRDIGVNFLEIHYEDLVTDQEAVTRQVLEYIGAPWDDACLQHHKSKRVVRTASYAQVTQKVYTSSLYRYRNYHDAVQGIIPILEPTIRRFGYTTD